MVAAYVGSDLRAARGNTDGEYLPRTTGIRTARPAESVAPGPYPRQSGALLGLSQLHAFFSAVPLAFRSFADRSSRACHRSTAGARHAPAPRRPEKELILRRARAHLRRLRETCSRHELPVLRPARR